VEDIVGLGFDPLIFVISHPEIQRCDINRVHQVFLEMLQPKHARDLRQHVSIAVDGYDDDQRELVEIPEVRAWFQKFDNHWPYCFFFLDPDLPSNLRLFAGCVCPIEFVGGVVYRSPSKPIRRLRFTDRFALNSFWDSHFAAMKAICDGLGDTEETIAGMTQRILSVLGLEDSEE